MGWRDRLLSRWWYLRGIMARNWGNFTGRGAPYRTAVSHLSRAISRDPDWVEPVFVRGVLYWRALLDPDAAIADFSRVLELSPDWAEAIFNRGMAQQNRGDFRAAIADFEMFIERAPDSLWARHARRQMQQLNALVRELSARDKDHE